MLCNTGLKFLLKFNLFNRNLEIAALITFKTLLFVVQENLKFAVLANMLFCWTFTEICPKT